MCIAFACYAIGDTCLSVLRWLRKKHKAVAADARMGESFHLVVHTHAVPPRITCTRSDECWPFVECGAFAQLEWDPSLGVIANRVGVAARSGTQLSDRCMDCCLVCDE